MISLSSEQLREKFAANDTVIALFLFTPLCGTCSLTEKMLNVIEHMHPGLKLYKSNINLSPDIAKQWEIASVPCLLLIQQQTIQQKIYAMHSVDHLYRVLQPVITLLD
jgi:thioredoxin-like negative regulator of GroEL